MVKVFSVTIAAAALGLVSCSNPTVPDVVGMDLAEAREEVEAAGFEVGVRREVDDGAEVDEVLTVQPSPGTEPAEGERVMLTVAEEFSTVITGGFTLTDDDNIGGRSPGGTVRLSGQLAPGDDCFGFGGYQDIRAGMRATVTDGEGMLLGTGQTGPGIWTESGCRFEFTIQDVPRADFYTIEVGSRGDLSYSFDELEQQNWNLEFTLG